MSTSTKRHRGRPPGRQPRPHIPIPGDTLVPKHEAAAGLGISARTLTRMRVPSAKFAGVSYVAIGKMREIIAAGLSSPKAKRGRR
jgi:hypothetical protein